MTPQEENARILLSHSQVKPEFLQHSGMFISDLCEKVFRIVPAPKLEIVTNEPERLRLRAELLASLKALEPAWRKAYGRSTEPEPEPQYMPGLCWRCFNYREVTKDLGYETGQYEMIECPECVL